MRMTDSLSDIARELERADTIALCGHHHPDGDCVGSVCALAHLLRGLGKEVQPLLCTEEPVPDVYRFLVEADSFVPAGSYTATPDVFLALDISGCNRLKDALAVLSRAGRKLSVDHHAGPDEVWDLCYDDPSCSATGLLVWEFAGLLGVEPDAAFATACYVAMMTDTGRFQFQNTDARTFRAAATACEAGADPADISARVYQSRTRASIRVEALVFERMQVTPEGTVVYSWLSDDDLERLQARSQDADRLVDSLRTLGGVRVALMLRVSGVHVRGSIRAKDDTDVAAVASKLGGGGHRAAAGFVLEGTLQQAFDRVLPLLRGI